MLQTLLAVVNFIKTVVYHSFLLSWKTGRFIITTGRLILTWLTAGVDYLFEAIKVLLEDFHPFACDIVGHLHLFLRGILCVIDGCFSFLQIASNAISEVINGAVSGAVHTYNEIANGFLSVAGVVVQVFAFAKRILILFGSGVWFLVTLLPLSVVSLVIYSTYCLGLLLEETKNLTTTFLEKINNVIVDVYVFVTDVPLESLAGLVVGVCLIYILVQFHMELYGFLQQKFHVFVELARRNLFTFRWNFPKLSLTRRISQESTSVSETEETEDSEEKNCVICQERVKNMLLLPCKHVCLCTHCEVRLKNYGYKCPVCRTHVHRTMKVFI